MGMYGGDVMRRFIIFIMFVMFCLMCPTAQANHKVVYLYTNITSPWTVPADWSNTNTIEVIGAGGGGATSLTGFDWWRRRRRLFKDF